MANMIWWPRSSRLVKVQRCLVIQLSEPKRVIVKGANVSGIELATRPLGSVSGQIVLESSKVPECQGKRPPLLAETLVQLRRPERDPEKDPASYCASVWDVRIAGPRGGVRFTQSVCGQVSIRTAFLCALLVSQSITSTAARPRSQPASKTDAAANWTTVKFGEHLTNLTITLAEGAASVRGKLDAGEPAPGTVLYLVPSEQDKAERRVAFLRY